MEKVVGEFSVKYLQIMDDEGNVDKELMPKLSASVIKKMYEDMVFARVWDDKALKLQRQGRMGTYAQSKGQEACQIGSAINAGKDDWIFPAFREHPIFLMKGLTPEMVFAFWAGDERGMQIPKGINMFPVAITVGAHLPHAVGAAMAFTIQKKKAATMVYFGDGATSEGDFHEAMNFAGARKAPTVFICQNNQWAISVPVREQTASETIAQKAIAYGFEGIKVDGNDIFAVYKASKEALEKARAGKGPTLIECLTYRVSDHTTSDDAKKYRSVEEVKKWEMKDPILRLKKYMMKNKMFSEKYEKTVWANAEKEIDKAVAKMEAMTPQGPEEMFKYMYSAMTPDLKEQQEWAVSENKIITDTRSTGKGGGVVGELEEAK